MDGEDNYKSFFYNNENIESIYLLLKGDEKELSKENLKKYIESFEGIEYEGNFVVYIKHQ
jgi:hypothetical protein